MRYVDLKEMMNHGVFNIKVGDCITLSGVRVTPEQLNGIVRQAGWSETYASDIDIIKKTKTYAKTIVDCFDNSPYAQYLNIEFINKRSDDYGKDFDLIHIDNNSIGLHGFKRITITHGMKNNGGNYVIYKDYVSAPVKKCKSLKEVVSYIKTL